MTRLARLAAACLRLSPESLRKSLINDAWREHALCLLLWRHRLRLRQVTPGALFPAFDEAEIRLQTLPRGNWAAPVVDLVYLLKLVSILQPTKVLELGSFRGYTALGIASHLGDAGRLVAVDINPEHGEAYRDHPLAGRIERRIGAIGPEIFSDDKDASYDLIFIDADHRLAAVKDDTETVFRLLRHDGLMIWHDYANWGVFNGACGVPEYLHALNATRPIVHLAGSNLAIHSPAWESLNSPPLQAAIQKTREGRRGGAWATESNRS